MRHADHAIFGLSWSRLSFKNVTHWGILSHITEQSSSQGNIWDNKGWHDFMSGHAPAWFSSLTSPSPYTYMDALNGIIGRMFTENNAWVTTDMSLSPRLHAHHTIFSIMKVESSDWELITVHSPLSTVSLRVTAFLQSCLFSYAIRQNRNKAASDFTSFDCRWE